MKRSPRLAVACVTALLGLAACGGPNYLGSLEDETPGNTASKLTGFQVLTRNYDNKRSGANLSETSLVPSKVASTTFGKHFEMPVDDQIYAGLLWASGVVIGGVPRNVVYVATVNNTIYAFDADKAGSPIWTRASLGLAPNNTQVGVGAPYCGGGYNDFSGKLGIVGTPVIDAGTETMYFVSRTVADGTPGAAHTQKLYAIDIKTGNNVVGPVTISASVTGTGDGGSTVNFNSKTQNQRSALTLVGNNVYIAWSGHCDTPQYHGWVLAYDKGTLAQVAKFNTTPNGAQGGIWHSGGGPIVDDSNNLYYGTGNGTNGGGTPGFANSVVKLAPSDLSVQSSFTAGDWANLNTNDNDLGSGGPTFIPGSTNPRIFTAGKVGKGYVLNSSSLGGLVGGDTQIPQSWQVVDTSVRPGSTKHVHSSSVYWNGPQGLNMFVWGENDRLHAFRFNTGTQLFNTTPQLNGSVLAPLTVNGMPGGFMAVSANGSTANTGILWATTPTNADANHATVGGTFRAFDAQPPSGTTLTLLWESSVNARQSMENLAKYNPPVVANGRAYVPTFSNKVVVYGLQSPYPTTAAAVPGTIEAENFDLGGEGASYHDTTTGNSGAAYRNGANDDVDIEGTTDTGGGFDVGFVAATEWLEYTVNAATTSAHTVTARVASMAAGTIGVQVDGGATSTISFPNTMGWQTWQTVTAGSTVTVPSGTHVVRVTFNNGCNLNWINFTASGPPPSQGPYLGTPWAIPGTIEAENYDVGGEGIAFHDTAVGNQGGAYRTAAGDDVDIEGTSDTGGGFNVGFIAATEWLEFTVNATTTATHTVSARIASMAAGTMSVQVDGGTASTISFPNTMGWQTWQTVTAGSTLTVPSGNHVVRVTFNDGCNLNWINFTPSGGGGPTVYNAAADTYGRDGTTYSNTNCNTSTSCGSTTATEIEIKSNAGAGFTRETYIQFTSVAGSTASNATLHLCTVNNADFELPGTSRSVIVEGIATDSWTETALTWNNRPLDAGQNPVTLTVATAGNCLDFNVTTFVNAQLVGGDHTISLRVKALDADIKRTPFANRSGANPPTLTVTN